MAGSPRWKVYNPQGEYVAACKHTEDAACLVAFYGDGATIRDGHTKIVWNEGHEECPASESYDTVADTILDRTATKNTAAEPTTYVPGFGYQVI